MARPSTRSAAGFSLLELLVAVSLVLVVVAAVFDVVRPALGSSGVAAETSDVQQRVRVAVDALTRDLLSAGRGASGGRFPGPLTDGLAAVLPFRQGRRAPDGPGVVRADVITIFAAAAGAAQTTLAQDMPARSGTVRVNLDAGCPAGDPACGFRGGMSVLVFNETGAFDTFTVTGVAGAELTLLHDMADSAVLYGADLSRILEITARTYSLKTDQAADTSQLVQYDGAGGGDVPVVNHLVGLGFGLLADPQPPRLIRPLSETKGPWTTYGPVPPAATARPTSFPPGESCVFQLDAAGMPAPRLAVLGGGSLLVRLTAAQLTDGPWCPDGESPSRYNADLLRVRSIVVTVKVESALAAFRGPAGPLFTRAGTSTDVQRQLPDQSMRVEISPRNLNLER